MSHFAVAVIRMTARRMASRAWAPDLLLGSPCTPSFFAPRSRARSWPLPRLFARPSPAPIPIPTPRPNPIPTLARVSTCRPRPSERSAPGRAARTTRGLPSAREASRSPSATPSRTASRSPSTRRAKKARRSPAPISPLSGDCFSSSTCSLTSDSTFASAPARWRSSRRSRRTSGRVRRGDCPGAPQLGLARQRGLRRARRCGPRALFGEGRSDGGRRPRRRAPHEPVLDVRPDDADAAGRRARLLASRSRRLNIP